MALRREEAEPELRVVRGRGRPPKLYPELPVPDDDARRLAAHLLHGFRREGPFPTWYEPAEHERVGDDITEAWLDSYTKTHPAAWRRMRRNTRHADGDAHFPVQGLRGTLKGPKRRVAMWRERTAKDKSERDAGLMLHASTDSATTGGSAAGVDVNEYFTGDLARLHYDTDDFSPDELRRRLWGRVADADVRYLYDRAMDRLMTEAAAVLWTWSPRATVGLLRRGGAWLDAAERKDEDRDQFREVSKRLRAAKRFLSLSRLLSEGPSDSLSAPSF